MAARKGALNVISASPTDEFSGRVSATAGDYQTTDVAAVVSGPLVDDTVSGRIGAFYNRSRGTNFRPAYSLVNASYKQSFNGNNWSVLFWGKNLTNKTVFLNTTTTATPNVLIRTAPGAPPYPAASLEFANLNEPRTYGITAQYLW